MFSEDEQFSEGRANRVCTTRNLFSRGCFGRPPNWFWEKRDLLNNSKGVGMPSK